MDKKWTNEPPTEPGWWWLRWQTDLPEVARVEIHRTTGKFQVFYHTADIADPMDNISSYQEWWPIPIEEPPV